MLMDHSMFWRIIQTAKDGAQGDQDKQLDLIREALIQLPAESIIAFDHIMDEYRALSYRRDLWAAATIINAGCSDDGFDYFRAWLIAQGRRVFESALQNPETLHEVIVMDPDWEAGCEGFLYVALEAYEQKTGRDMPIHPAPPQKLTGLAWSEDIDEMFPELSRKASSRWDRA